MGEMSKRPLTAGALLGLIACILIIISFSTPYWLVNGYYHQNHHSYNYPIGYHHYNHFQHFCKPPHGFKNIGLWQICVPTWKTLAHYGAGIFSDHYANGQPSGLGSFGHSTGGDYHDTHNKHNYCIWLFDDDIYYLRRFIEQPFFIACQTLWSFELFFSCLALIILLPAPILKAPKAAMALSAASGLITFFCFICGLIVCIVFGVMGPYWGWVHDNGICLGIPYWLPYDSVHQFITPGGHHLSESERDRHSFDHPQTPLLSAPPGVPVHPNHAPNYRPHPGGAIFNPLTPLAPPPGRFNHPNHQPFHPSDQQRFHDPRVSHGHSDFQVRDQQTRLEKRSESHPHVIARDHPHSYHHYKSNNYLGWSYILGVIGMSLQLFASLLMFADVGFIRKQSSQRSAIESRVSQKANIDPK